ncbi:hypothetical protein PGT21_011188 [Puccinia graminis f. sp. tritici]|uniref:Uncharacterized protein n=1 Tax=Puccinia graminis f. sp. tritici TaxID=56615 RepID=A0A5B0NBR7_PUCGR|nr:hypothetical protein PGT21_011188 [Puccinia graminis f. sp. tritici]KAA1135969.1 hypothetical protein PGTUg99_013843 [Puccinia graminis f. sp. tritici]
MDSSHGRPLIVSWWLSTVERRRFGWSKPAPDLEISGINPASYLFFDPVDHPAKPEPPSHKNPISSSSSSSIIQSTPHTYLQSTRRHQTTMSANYAIYTSPNHQPIPDHLPTLIVTPQGKPHQVLYTYLHTNYNQENYLLTPSDQGDLCVAKLFPPNKKRAQKNSTTAPPAPSSSNGHHPPQSSADRSAIKCEASRNLKWTIRNEGIQNPVYKLTLPNPENPQVEQPLFQVSKPNPNCPWWTLFYFTYAGHLIPPKRIEFGKILKAQPNGPKASGETKITVTGKTEEEKAVWRTLGEGNEDMVEWILVCAALNVLDEEISRAAEAAGVQLSARPSTTRAPPSGPSPAGGPMQKPHSMSKQPGGGHPSGAGQAADRQLHPTGNAHRPPVTAPIRPAVYSNHPPPSKPVGPSPPSSHHRPSPQQMGQPGSANNQRAIHHPPQQQQQHYPSSRGPPHSGHGPSPGGLPPGALPSGMGPRAPQQDVYHDASDLAYTRSTRQPQQLPPSSQHRPQQQPHPHQPPRSNNSYPNPHHHHPHSSPPSQNFVPHQQPHGPRARLPHPPANNPAPLPGSNSSASRAPIQINNYPIQTHSKQVR